MLFDLNTQRNQICNMITDRSGILKIVLKTKNDPILLKKWITHHQKICGSNNLIIFDNMSTDQDVLNLYGVIDNAIIVIRFSGYHNQIHHNSFMEDIYKAIKDSSRYFCLLDTDEYLIGMDGMRVMHLNEISNFFSTAENNIYPGIWLYNSPGSEKIFKITGLIDGVKWGKPIISTNLPKLKYILHNIQLPESIYGTNVTTNFFILHLTRFSSQQRIRANINKLISFGFAVEHDSLEQILSRSIPEFKGFGNIQQFVMEINNLIKNNVEPFERLELQVDEIEIIPGQIVRAFSDTEIEIFKKFIGVNRPSILKALEIRHEV